MTEQDLKDAALVAKGLVSEVQHMRPPAAVAALAFALAVVAHLARCGPGAAIATFNSYYKRLIEMSEEEGR